jgi:hypothetical protein
MSDTQTRLDAIREWVACKGVYQADDGPVIRFPSVEEVETLLAELARVTAENETLRAALDKADSFLADPSGNPIDAINFARQALAAARGARAAQEDK